MRNQMIALLVVGVNLVGCVHLPVVKRGESEQDTRARIAREFAGKQVSEIQLPNNVTRTVYEYGSPSYGNRIVVFYRNGLVEDVEYQTGR
jgi:hypothetical protein